MGDPSTFSFHPVCDLVPDSKPYRRIAVRSVHLDGQTLIVSVQGERFVFAHVIFRDITGFRVLEEGALMEFWSNYSEPNGWLWEVKSGGWLDLERTREGHGGSLAICLRAVNSAVPVREFFVVDEYCISVLCPHPPEILHMGGDLSWPENE